MAYKPRKQSNWRDYLTDDERKIVEFADKIIADCRAQMRDVVPDRAFIQNRAIQRMRYQKAARAAKRGK